ncbi:uncharacterized protein J3R85_006501 [Psidium guajava]|nr:uncharacterized protein J3R85_006501 [Psidium guajava]
MGQSLIFMESKMRILCPPKMFLRHNKLKANGIYV